MEKKYFAVTTKCGHVGKGKFIIKTFAIVASDGKDAAEIARWLPRVKHHNKECILDVKKISEEMFQVLLEENSKDLYFQCRNVQEQKEKCPEIYEDVQNLYSKSKDYTKVRKSRVERKFKLKNIMENEFRNILRDFYEDNTSVLA